MDYFTYNSSAKVQAHYAKQQQQNKAKQQQQTRSEFVANKLLANSKRYS